MEPKKEEPNKPGDQPNEGKGDGNGGGNPTPEDVKNLQKIISEKDKALKDAEAKLAEIAKGQNDNRSEVEKVISALKDEIKSMADEVKNLNTEKRRDTLAQKYPDILPELIIGKTDEEIDKIVENQRALSKKLYGDSDYFRAPTYRDGAAVDEEIDAVKKDPKKTGFDSAVEVLKLNRIKDVFKN